MSQPKPRSDYAKARRLCRPFLFFGIAACAVAIDWALRLSGRFAVAAVLGAALHYTMSGVFTYVSFRHSKTGGQALGYMALALMLKWIIGIVGFLCLFAFLPRSFAPAALLGFVAMQCASFVALWRFGQKL